MVGVPSAGRTQVPEKDDYLIDLTAVIVAVMVGILVGWGVSTLLSNFTLVLIVDSILTFVVASLTYFASFVYKEKKYNEQ